MELKETHPILARYLRYTRNTESPALFHSWAFLSGVSAALGRRCWYKFGTYVTLPNMFVVLCGPPSLRKSSAINPVRSLLQGTTGVRFAPSDTGGQRQGLIEAMLGENEKLEDSEDDKQIEVMLAKAGSVGELFEEKVINTLNNYSLDSRDPNSMFISAPNLSSVIGENNSALLTFMQQLYDGEDYSYHLKNSVRLLKDSVLGMLAGTTASAFAQSIQSPVMGQDFMARCIFVYADEQKIRKIPRPSLNEEMRPEFAKIFERVYNELSGEFSETSSAAKLLDEIYVRGVSLLDTRFVHYVQRRQTHLQKVSMALAASRCSLVIDECDVVAADAMLSLTEDGMPYALGEYGLAKLSAAKAKLSEMLCSTVEGIPVETVFTIMSKDMKPQECEMAIRELELANRIRYVDIPHIGRCVIGVSSTDAARNRKRKASATHLFQQEAEAKAAKRQAAMDGLEKDNVIPLSK